MKRKLTNKHFLKLKVRHNFGKKAYLQHEKFVNFAEIIFAMFIFHGTNFHVQAVICIFCVT